MSEEALLTMLFMFVVLCITINNMHSNHLKHKYTKSQHGTSKKDIKKYGGVKRMYDKFERPSDKTMEKLFGAGREKEPPSEELLEELRDVAKKNKDGEDYMASVEEQINEIQTKDELIKWLINEYFILSNKAYGDKFKEVIDKELNVIKSKAGTLMTSGDSTYEYEFTNKQILHGYYNYSGGKAGIEELYEVYKKAKKYNEIYNAINAQLIEYPEEEVVPEVYMTTKDKKWGILGAKQRR